VGFKVEIGGRRYESKDWSVVEAATPLAAGDSSGQTGTIDITFPKIDADRFPDHPVTIFGPEWFIDKSVRLADSRKGFTIGEVESVTRNDSSGEYTLRCQTRLGTLNVYGVQAQPFVGTLGAAFDYYLSLANIETDFYVEETIASRPVTFVGWEGELWFHLKQMAAAQDCDISLVSGIVLLRPIRSRYAIRGRDLERSHDVGGTTLAQGIEVYRYNARAITNELVYPPNGWTPEVEVLNVNAGETAEYTLELSASVSSIQTPTMQTFVPDEYSSSSVYTIVANDGLAIPPDQWTAAGGRVTFRIERDTRSVKVSLRGAWGLFTSQGDKATNFSLALASDASGNRYSTLRIVGSGVAYTKEKTYIRTGVPASKTSTVVGVTIDNPFINTVNDLYRAGTRAAKMYTGYAPTLSGSVTAINRRGDSGSADYSTYGEVQDSLQDELVSPTYGEVRDYTVGLGNTTYGEDYDYWFSRVRDSNVNQVFGNVQGCRIFDKPSRRWYRIRTGTLTPPNIQRFEADDDLIHGDMEEYFTLKGYTYADVQAPRNELTYRQDEMAGMYG
jgi:hypothetical protein